MRMLSEKYLKECEDRAHNADPFHYDVYMWNRKEKELSEKDAEIQQLTEYKETHQLQTKYVAELEEKWADQQKEIQQLKEELKWAQLKHMGFTDIERQLFEENKQLKSKGASKQQIADAIEFGSQLAISFERGEISSRVYKQKESEYLSRFNGGAAPQETDKK